MLITALSVAVPAGDGARSPQRRTAPGRFTLANRADRTVRRGWAVLKLRFSAQLLATSRGGGVSSLFLLSNETITPQPADSGLRGPMCGLPAERSSVA